MLKLKLTLKYMRNKLLYLTGYFYSNFKLKSSLSSIIYIVEKNNWSIYLDGLNITSEINKKINNNFAEISCQPYKFRNKIIHFGSQYMWVDWYKYLSKENKYIVNFYHGKYEDGADIKLHIDEFLKSTPYIYYILTASTLIQKRLISWGVPKKKIVLIPIGVNTKIFKPPSFKNKIRFRKKLGFFEDEFVIGSFQKDGVGWGAGLEPKFIKGPDILVEVLKILAKKIKIKVLLTGPARGFVKNKLNFNNIPYTHVYLNTQESISEYYKALDLYLVTSREEGGPKGILEGLSSGIPVASTDVGMARDLIKNNKNGILLDSYEPEKIAKQILSFIHSKNKLNIKEMRKCIYKSDWEMVAKDHYTKLYKPLCDL